MDYNAIMELDVERGRGGGRGRRPPRFQHKIWRDIQWKGQKTIGETGRSQLCQMWHCQLKCVNVSLQHVLLHQAGWNKTWREWGFLAVGGGCELGLGLIWGFLRSVTKRHRRFWPHQNKVPFFYPNVYYTSEWSGGNWCSSTIEWSSADYTPSHRRQKVKSRYDWMTVKVVCVGNEMEKSDSMRGQRNEAGTSCHPISEGKEDG